MEDWAEVQRLFHREGLTKRAIASSVKQFNVVVSPIVLYFAFPKG